MKGYKRNKWFKDGIKLGKKLSKKYLNRRVRRNNKELMNHNSYKKIGIEEITDIAVW